MRAGGVAWLRRYLETLGVRNYSPSDVAGTREWHLAERSVVWCEARSVTRPEEVTKPMVDRYQRHLFLLAERATASPLSFRIAGAGADRRCAEYFKWLTRTNVLLWNPASELEFPRHRRSGLPKHVLDGGGGGASAGAAERRRRRSGCAIGRSSRRCTRRGSAGKEVAQLTVFDLDTERGHLDGAARQREARIGWCRSESERSSWIQRYQQEVRGGAGGAAGSR